jgi:hypothetical protein
MEKHRLLVPHLDRRIVLVSLALVTLVACGGEGPSQPSANATDVVVKGTVLGTAFGSSSAYGLSSLASPVTSITASITVAVEGRPGISTIVSSDGSFTLRGLPTDSFTLVFSREGAPLGTLRFNTVLPNQELTITVNLTGNAVVLVDEKRNGIGHGDIEVEGSVDQVLVMSASGESRFIVNGRTVVVRPGQTAIRQGNTPRQVSDLTVGRRVHVKGTFLPMEGSVQPVLATEIVLQGSGDSPAATPTPAPTPASTPRAACIIDGGTPGRSIELEGTVVGGNASAFRLDARASNPIDVLAGGATLVCTPPSGPNAPTPAQCSASVTAGARVHVSGTLDSCSATAAQVTAGKVTVQK